MANPHNVQRKNRGTTIRRKLMQYASMFNLQIALVTRSKTSGEYELFQSELDENFPPARREFSPFKLFVGEDVTTTVATAGTSMGDTTLSNLELDLQRMKMRILLQPKLPKPPVFNA
ncbi:hypothetical protein F5X98DRAFT_381891 [Xylaria grammica]|nr:hypothetical protein F5X98DRAFT_381891 [Xylaria grammica]